MEAKPDSDPIAIPGARSDTGSDAGLMADDIAAGSSSSSPNQADSTTNSLANTPKLDPTAPSSPRISRHPSFGSSSYHDDWESYPPLDRLTVLDLLDNFALPQQLEKLQKGISAQTEKVRKSRAALRERGQEARERMVEEWRRRVPSADEQLERYRKRMKKNVENLSKQWNDTKVITLREKVSFICATMNIFISGYLIGAFPQWFHLWYTVQLIYFMPIRYYTYHRRGYHYFLADLCYFVNFLLFLSLWVFPSSKRMFISSYSLAMGNNAVAIVMWRNSLVFHDFDKVTSLFIHIMPCATLHCITHLLSPEQQKQQFPALWVVKNSPPGSPTAYANIISMLAWSTIPYALWQLSYYFFITVRRREKIAAGRPTSYTWLRKSYAKTALGRFVLWMPAPLQEATFMFIQYAYAVLTMLPCPLWFYSRWASSGFLMVVFVWSVYNGSTYYIDVFGKRFQRELESLRSEVAKWQSNPDLTQSPLITPMPMPGDENTGSSKQLKSVVEKEGGVTAATTAAATDDDEEEEDDDDSGVKVEVEVEVEDPASGKRLSVDEIPLLDDKKEKKSGGTVASGFDDGGSGGKDDGARERKPGNAADI